MSEKKPLHIQILELLELGLYNKMAVRSFPISLSAKRENVYILLHEVQGSLNRKLLIK